jgi:hypothetical protein
MKLVFFLKSELLDGLNVEKEHVNTIKKIKQNPKLSDKSAEELIAKDHIKESKDKNYNYYSRLLASENLEDYTGIEKKIIDYMKNKKGKISDEKDIHKLAKKLGINTHVFEEKIYNILDKIVGNKAK